MDLPLEELLTTPPDSLYELFFCYRLEEALGDRPRIYAWVRMHAKKLRQNLP